ncbi:MAG: hypothetical protein RL386_174 [Bacteroidota bacterium]
MIWRKAPKKDVWYKPDTAGLSEKSAEGLIAGCGCHFPFDIDERLRRVSICDDRNAAALSAGFAGRVELYDNLATFARCDWFAWPGRHGTTAGCAYIAQDQRLAAGILELEYMLDLFPGRNRSEVEVIFREGDCSDRAGRNGRLYRRDHVLRLTGLRGGRLFQALYSGIAYTLIGVLAASEYYGEEAGEKQCFHYVTHVRKVFFD